jgi:hypothetical protein
MRLETRGPEIGTCNLCGVTTRLTEDHIPPKGVPLVGQAYLERLIDSLGAERSQRAGRLFQRGVKYRSICGKCNNEALGQAFDPTLIKFCKEVRSSLSEHIYLPVTIEVQQNRLFRSVVGHLLAHGIGTYRMGPFTALKTTYFADPAAVFPPDLRLYCWVYPYKRQVAARGIASIFDFRFKSEPFVFSILKFFPVAWMCSTAELPDYVSNQVVRVDQLSTINIDDHGVISLNPSNVPSPRWPEAPGKNGVVFHNGLGTVARPVDK